MAERLSKLGTTLSTVSNHYNNTVKALAGQQGLYGKVDRFSQLSAKVSKSLPQLEATHMDFETERLVLIVEPIDEQSEDQAGDQTDNSVDELDQKIVLNQPEAVSQSDEISAAPIESETTQNH